MSESYLVVELNQQPVELCKLLKIANLVSGGGEAKVVISEGYVLLNGEVEYQKRKKVYHEDVIEFNGEVIQLMINEELEVTQTSEPPSQSINKPLVEPELKNNKKPKQNKNQGKSKKEYPTENPVEAIPAGPKKRKPIAF